MIDDGWCSARAKLGVALGPTSAGASDCTRFLPVIRLASPDLARRIGLDTAAAVVEPPLELVALGHERAADRLTVRGAVRNPSNTGMDRLTAVVLLAVDRFRDGTEATF